MLLPRSPGSRRQNSMLLSAHAAPVALALVALAFVAAIARAQAPKDPSPQDPVYLFTSFHEPASDGLRFVWSADGYHWKEVAGVFLKPSAGKSKLMRDPSFLRGPDGTFHLVWTAGWKGDLGIGYASSKDLVHWSEQRFIPVMEHEPTTVNVWAPELYYDDQTKDFIICWASTIPGRFPDHAEPHENNHRMYYTTTKDFKEFAPTKLFCDPDFSIIDCQIVKANLSEDKPYVLVLKDNSRTTLDLHVAFGKTPLGPWTDVSPAFTEKFSEGPTVAKVGDDWLIYYDAYRKKIYGAAKTRDFKTFTDVTAEVEFPKDHKHGTVITVPRSVVDYLIKVGPQQVSGLRLPWTTPLSQDQIDKRLAEIDAVANRGPFKPDWDSIGKFKTPSWYRDGKFGIFIHWGAYSVPAFGSEWYPRNMYKADEPTFQHHIDAYGPQSKFGYKDLIEQFKAEKFDAAAWAKLFKDSGAKYIVPVAEHHDGFPMYASDCTEWCAAKRGPKRDVLGELTAAFRKEGLTPGASSHRAEHWWFFDHGMRFDSDVKSGEYAALYGPAGNQRVAENQAEQPDAAFLDDWLLRNCEIVDKYHPQLFYFDWWICQPVFQPYLKRFAAYYYNRGAEWGDEVAINFKEWEGRSFPDGAGVFDIERGQSATIRPDFWQTDTSLAKNTWGYTAKRDFRTADSVVDDLADIVSKNGALLLNIGPKPDGTIADEEQELLRGIGRWLAVNGEAIYGTRPWKTFGEGPTQVVAGSFADVKRAPFTAEDFRFTTKGDALYAIALAWPENGKLIVRSLPRRAFHAWGAIGDVKLLGSDSALTWRQTDQGLIVELPAKAPCDYAVTLKISAPTEQPAAPPSSDAAAPASADKPADKPATAAAEDKEEAEYTRVINERSDKIIVPLNIADEKLKLRVRDSIAGHYRAIRDIDAERDAALKSAPDDAAKTAIKAAADVKRVTAHRQFVARLDAMLSPADVNVVKDGLTYNVVPITWKRYQELLPNLTDEQRTFLLACLLEAREYAMDAGSSKEKHDWFGKYKGRINNYLAKEGYNMKQAEKDLAVKEKAAKSK